MEKDEKKKRWRKYYLLLLIIFFGVMSGTSTYAWFTVNRIVYVESLNVQVEAKGGLEISIDGSLWKSSVNGDDIRGAHETYNASVNQLPLKIEPVSTGGDIDNTGKLQMYYGLVENDTSENFVLASEKIIESEGNEEGKFVAFDIFLRTSKDQQLYLTNESKVTYDGEFNPGMENSLRFAFIVLGNTPSTSPLAVIQGLNNGDSSPIYIWEPNYDVHSSTGVSNAHDVYGITVGETGSEAVSYDGIINEIDKHENVYIQNANASNYPELFKHVNIDFLTTRDFPEYKEIFYLYSGVTKIRVYVWIEGQDVDCENGSSVGNINFNFQFSTNPA